MHAIQSNGFNAGKGREFCLLQNYKCPPNDSDVFLVG